MSETIASIPYNICEKGIRHAFERKKNKSIDKTSENPKDARWKKAWLKKGCQEKSNYSR